MPWTTATTRSTGFTVTAAVWNSEHVDNMNFLKEVNYTAFTSDVTISATTAATANQIVSAGAITYENVPHMIEFYCPSYAPPSAATTFVLIRDSTTILGTLARGYSLTSMPNIAIKLGFRVTPSAASHTYNIAAYVGSSSGVMNAGSGGSTGDATTDVAGYIRVYRIPT